MRAENSETSITKCIESSSISSLLNDTLEDCNEYLRNEETNEEQVKQF